MAECTRSLRATLLGNGLLILALVTYFGYGLDAEPEFVDESANIAHTYYFQLLSRGELHHIDWLHPAAYDHLPMFKYLIGTAVWLGGHEPMNSLQPWEAWMQRTFNPSEMPQIGVCLRSARVAMMLGAVFGCWMMYRLGRRLVGPKTGAAAAFLLATSPVYYVHARRAMADDLTQSFVIASLLACAGMLNAKGTLPTRLGRGATCGGFLGLAAATKLNGVVAGLVIGSTSILIAAAMLLKRDHMPAKAVVVHVALSVGVAGFVGIGTFIAINPFLYAAPDVDAVIAEAPNGHVTVQGALRRIEYVADLRLLAAQGVLGRTRRMLEHRKATLEHAPTIFPKDALRDARSRAVAIVTEGIGRWFAGGYGVADRTAGLQLGISNKWWWAIPGFVALCGWWFAWKDGLRQLGRGQLPAAWLLVAWPLVEIVTLLNGLTLNWDRYFLGVVTCTSMLVAYGVSGAAKRAYDRMALLPAEEEPTK